MGEIGITRNTFLYDLCFWETRCIIRGYRRRDRLKHQLMAQCVYAATYAMRDAKGKTVKDMFPVLFEDDDDDEPESPLTEEDQQHLIDLMQNYQF